MRGALAAFFITCLLSLPATAREETEQHITVDGTMRDYLRYVPKQGHAPYPVIILFHGGGSKASAMPRFTGMSKLAEENGFIALYPQGINKHWNDGRPTTSTVDDVAFVQKILEETNTRYTIDPSRVFAAGISNGAIFSHALACRASGTIAAIAAVAGRTPANITCEPTHPVSVLQIDGTDDPIVPFDGGAVKSFGGAGKGGEVRSNAQAVNFWAKHDRCTAQEPSTALPRLSWTDKTNIERTNYTQCEGGAEVVNLVVQGGGHTWPGGPQYLPRFIIGTASKQLDASRTMVEFFLTHPKR